jgi:hypothetical protein
VAVASYMIRLIASSLKVVSRSMCFPFVLGTSRTLPDFNFNCITSFEVKRKFKRLYLVEISVMLRS